MYMYIYIYIQKNTHTHTEIYIHYVPKCMSCHKAIVVMIGRAHCFHAYIYMYIYMYTYSILYKKVVEQRSARSETQEALSLFKKAEWQRRDTSASDQ